MIKKAAKAFAVILLSLYSCTSATDKAGTFVPKDIDRRDEIRYKQYLVNGQRLFLTHCSNCHSKEGTGIGKLYPPLAKSDYLKNNIDKLACIIRYGQKGKIKVNGVEYNMAMPGNTELTNIQVAEIINFVSNSWGNQTGFLPVNKIEKQFKNCSPTD